MDSPSAETLRAKWLKWLEKIENDVYALQLNRARRAKLIEMAEGVDPLLEPWEFVTWVSGMFAVTQAVIIRRQALPGKHVSLGNLLQDIVRHPEALTRDWFVSLYGDSVALTWANTDFDKFAGERVAQVDPALVVADFRSLKNIASKVVVYVNKYVAHIDANPGALDLTYADLHAVLDEFDRLVKRYVLLLRAAGLMDTVPVEQSDWTLPFNRPWISNPGFEDWFQRMKERRPR